MTRRTLSWLLIAVAFVFVLGQGYLFNQSRLAQIATETERAAQLQRTRLLLYVSPDPLIMCSDQRRITAVNFAAAELLGWNPTELIGQSLSVIVAGNEQYGKHSVAFTRAVDQLVNSGIDYIIHRDGIEGTALTRTGEEVPITISVSGVHYQGHVEFVASIRVRDAPPTTTQAQRVTPPAFDTQTFQDFFPPKQQIQHSTKKD